ncbi:hypothetical protein K438DRAFT_1865025 [Mycena galopus ATCC 62051]|nr:hypothetical protein K438DRAFT_1865025 [Mycena galopus ATCC 62051]
MCTLPSNPTPAGERPATPCAITDTPPARGTKVTRFRAGRHEINLGPPPSCHPRQGRRTQDPVSPANNCSPKSNITQKKIQENPQA